MDRRELRASIEEACELDFVRAGGPGGQNVNKVNSKVQARVRLEELRGLSPAELERARMILASRLTKEGELLVQASEERDQAKNREAAVARLCALVAGAATLPKRRVPTSPGRAARERRLAAKRRHSGIKRDRGALGPGE